MNPGLSSLPYGLACLIFGGADEVEPGPEFLVADHVGAQDVELGRRGHRGRG